MLRKFAVAAVATAIALTLVNRLSADDPTSADGRLAPAATAATGTIEPLHGLAPLETSIELWRQRSQDHRLDYLSRTQLGLALATAATETGDLDRHAEAEAAFRDALALNPDHLPARLGLASAQIANHDFGAARDEVLEVLGQRPDSAPALALLGDAQLAIGQTAAAGRAYDRLATRERSAPVLSRLARLASATGRWDSAERLAAEALASSQELALRPSSQAFYWFQLGHVRFGSGDAVAALDAYDEALRIDPTHPGASEARAFTLAALGRNQPAAEQYRILLDRGPAADLHGSYAEVLRALGDHTEAERQERLGAELAAETEAGYPAERRHLVEFHLSRNPERAVELARADALTRDDFRSRDLVAWALHQSGRTTEAAEAIEQALATGAHDPRIQFHAGAIAAAQHRTDVAVGHLERALELNPWFHPLEADQARALLAEIDRDQDR